MVGKRNQVSSSLRVNPSCQCTTNIYFLKLFMLIYINSYYKIIYIITIYYSESGLTWVNFISKCLVLTKTLTQLSIPESGLTWVMLTCAATNPTLGQTSSAQKKLRLQCKNFTKLLTITFTQHSTEIIVFQN